MYEKIRKGLILLRFKVYVIRDKSGIADILKFGIAFSGKKVSVKTK